MFTLLVQVPIKSYKEASQDPICYQVRDFSVVL